MSVNLDRLDREPGNYPEIFFAAISLGYTTSSIVPFFLFAGESEKVKWVTTNGYSDEHICVFWHSSEDMRIPCSHFPNAVQVSFKRCVSVALNARMD